MIAPGMHLNCIQTCTEHALGVRSWCAHWCVPKTPRHPTGQAARVGTASFPRVRESSRCRKAPRIQRRRMHDHPRSAPELHSNLHQTCTRRAVMVRSLVRSEDSTHPTGQAARADLRHSRAFGNPAVVRKRPQFSAEGCVKAPGMHSKMHEPGTERARFQHVCHRCETVDHQTHDRIPASAGLTLFLDLGPMPAHSRSGRTRRSVSFFAPGHFPDPEFTSAPPFGRSHKYRLI